MSFCETLPVLPTADTDSEAHAFLPSSESVYATYADFRKCDLSPTEALQLTLASCYSLWLETVCNDSPAG